MVHSYWKTPNNDIAYTEAHTFTNKSVGYNNETKRDGLLQSQLQDNVSLYRSHKTKVLENSPIQRKEKNSNSLLSKEKQTHEVSLNIASTVSNKTHLCADFGNVHVRLGNKLFIYASLYGIAKKTNTAFVIEENAAIRNYFKYLKAEIVPKKSTICKDATYVSERKECCSFDPEFYNFPRNKNIKNKSYMQSYYYFKDVEDEIREQFTFKDEIEINARHRIQKALHDAGRDGKYSEIVGIHIRMGDKLDQHPVKQGNVVASKEFYNRAMNYFRLKLKSPVFLIIMSWDKDTDIKWVREHLKGNDVVFLGSNPLEVDLCALTLCDHTIMSIGTFGWWGAWLCNGITVYCKDFAAKGSELESFYNKDLNDYFPPNWIGM